MPRAPRIRRRTTRQPLVHLLPNLVTIGAICAGLTAIRFAFDHRFDAAVWLILLAALLDGLDGPLARMLKSESAIGAELDSLADFLNFGVAPGLLLYVWGLDDARRFGWIAVLIFAVCAVLRLARFNVSSKEDSSESGEPATKKGFVGVPAPGGALLALVPFAIERNWPGVELPAELMGLWLVGVGLMMISRLPTPSLKSARFSRDHARYFIVGLVAFFAVALTWPWAVMGVVQLAYVIVIAWAARHHAKRVVKNED